MKGQKTSRLHGVWAGIAIPVLLLGLLALPAAAATGGLSAALAAAKQGRLDEAYLLAQRAAAASPHDAALAAARELLQQRAVLAHLDQAHRYQAEHQDWQAAFEYRTALAIDPANLDARQGLVATLNAQPTPQPVTATELRVRNAAPPVQIQPAPGRHNFHLRSNLRSVVASVAAAYGLRTYIDNAVTDRRLPFDLTDANFSQAMTALHDAAGVDWIALDPHTLYFTDSSRLPRIEPMASRTFYVPWVSNGAALTQIGQTLRSLLGITQLSIDTGADAISVRAAPDQLDAAEQLLLDLNQPPGEVLLQIRVVSLSSTVAQKLGVNEPNQFTMFALTPLLDQLQKAGGLSQSILTLFEQGGLNAVLNSGALNPSQLASLQSAISPLLQNPFVVFGGGATLMALSVPSLSAQFSQTSGQVSSVETAVLRADSGQSAVLKVGQRYPIINASFAPISLNSAITKLIGNGTYEQPFPSFTYEDLGLDATLTPTLGPHGAIHLSVDLAVKALTGQSNDNIPIISDRHVVTDISMKNDQPVLIAGLLDREDLTSIAGLPGLGQIPALARLFSFSSPQTTNDQLALVITPYVVSLPPTSSASTWLPSSFPQSTAVPNLPPAVGPRLTTPTQYTPSPPARRSPFPFGIPPRPSGGTPPAAAGNGSNGQG